MTESIDNCFLLQLFEEQLSYLVLKLYNGYKAQLPILHNIDGYTRTL